MNLRCAMKGRRALTAVAIAAGLLLTVTGCGGGGDQGESKASSSAAPQGKDDSADQQGPPTGSVDKVLATAKDGDITITVTSAQRDQGGFVTVAGQVTNGGSSSWLGADWQSNETELAVNGGHSPAQAWSTRRARRSTSSCGTPQVAACAPSSPG
ncbi:hypothetical protein ACFQ0G_20930 [Streptomyces chiangmaiensis]